MSASRRPPTGTAWRSHCQMLLERARQDSNLRPLGPEPNALSTELQARERTGYLLRRRGSLGASDSHRDRGPRGQAGAWRLILAHDRSLTGGMGGVGAKGPGESRCDPCGTRLRDGHADEIRHGPAGGGRLRGRGGGRLLCPQGLRGRGGSRTRGGSRRRAGRRGNGVRRSAGRCDRRRRRRDRRSRPGRLSGRAAGRRRRIHHPGNQWCCVGVRRLGGGGHSTSLGCARRTRWADGDLVGGPERVAEHHRECCQGEDYNADPGRRPG